MTQAKAPQNPSLSRALEQRSKMDARIQLLRNRQASQDRKLDTRRKILAGAYFMKLLGNNLEKVGNKLLEAKMLQLRDRGLFFGDGGAAGGGPAS